MLARLLLCLGASLLGAAHAEPSSDDDPIGRYLQERGLVNAAEPSAPTPSPSLPDRTSEMVMTAMTFIDLPYRRGGSTADGGFDCSGFTRHIFQTSLGVALPRRVDEQASAPGLVKVQRERVEPGDLVFFNTLRRTFSHVGIYVGEGRFIHAPRTGGAVRLENMNIAYWSKRFTGARRAQGAGLDAPGARPVPAQSLLPAALHDRTAWR